MGKKSDPPKPPDLGPLAESSEKQAEYWYSVAKEQLAWAREVDAKNRGLLEQVLGVQLPQLEQAFEMAKEDRARYKDVFQPIEDNLVKEFQTYDTPQRRQQEASRRIADVRTAFEAQRTNATQALEDYGIDPSQTRFQALDLGYRAQEAAAAAFAANQGQDVVEQTGRALRGEAINIGRGYPSQVAQSQGVVNQTAGGAVGNATGVTGAGAGAFNSAMAPGQMGLAGMQQAAGIRNMGYQNQLSNWQGGQAQQAGFWGGLGSLAGATMGAAGAAEGFRNLFGEEGGAVPQQVLSTRPNTNDTVPAMLQEGEYVIPADVVRRKGTEFFDKLLAKFKDGGEYETKKAIPANGGG